MLLTIAILFSTGSSQAFTSQHGLIGISVLISSRCLTWLPLLLLLSLLFLFSL